MKVFTLATAFFIFCNLFAQSQPSKPNAPNFPNIFLITIDGYRWQELFKGADTQLLRNTKYVYDTSITVGRWDDETEDLRRKKLMPFIWNIVAKKGSLYGNRTFNNKVDVANIYKFSYPGYNEILTGKPDIIPVFNTPTFNKNKNILSALDTCQPYKNKVAAFCSWNILKYILNPSQCNFPINAGYEKYSDDVIDSLPESLAINALQEEVTEKEATRYDELTFMHAKQYIKSKQPKLMMLGFGETDEFAHQGKYDMYLQQANKIDNMIGELWYELQQIPFYKNNTIFIITTDHGRGKKQNTWAKHLGLIKGSGETWMAILGNNIIPEGEVKNEQQLYQKQIASTIAFLAHQTIKKFNPSVSILKANNILTTTPAKQCEDDNKLVAGL